MHGLNGLMTQLHDRALVDETSGAVVYDPAPPPAEPRFSVICCECWHRGDNEPAGRMYLVGGYPTVGAAYAVYDALRGDEARRALAIQYGWAPQVLLLRRDGTPLLGPHDQGVSYAVPTREETAQLRVA